MDASARTAKKLVRRLFLKHYQGGTSMAFSTQDVLEAIRQKQTDNSVTTTETTRRQPRKQPHRFLIRVQ
jgi:hypothetical protein